MSVKQQKNTDVCEMRENEHIYTLTYIHIYTLTDIQKYLGKCFSGCALLVFNNYMFHYRYPNPRTYAFHIGIGLSATQDLMSCRVALSANVFL